MCKYFYNTEKKSIDRDIKEIVITFMLVSEKRYSSVSEETLKMCIRDKAHIEEE